MKVINNIRKNAFIILLITIAVMYFVLKDDFNDIVNILFTVDLKYILLAIVIFFLSLFFKAYISYKTVNDKKKYSLLEAFKHNIIVQFFNGVTPFSTGGQPMEIYMLTKHKISSSKSTMITLQNFIFYQIALVLFGLGAVIYNSIYNIFPKVPILKRLVLIGFLINTLVAVVIILVSISKKVTKSFIRLIINILSKLKIIKNKEKTTKRWDDRLEEFHECATYLRENKKLFILGILFNIISLACVYITPLFIVNSMKDFSSLNVGITITSSAYVLLIGAFVPIPGGSGGIEYGFLAFFGNFLSKSRLSAVLLIWRFITYYMPMIIGAIAFNLDEREKKL